MPVITVNMLEGRSREQKSDLVEAITTAMVEICKAKPEGIAVVIQEVPRENWGQGGILVSER